MDSKGRGLSHDLREWLVSKAIYQAGSETSRHEGVSKESFHFYLFKLHCGEVLKLFGEEMTRDILNSEVRELINGDKKGAA